MAKDLGVDIIIKNTPGAGGRTGTVALYKSKPDGHTIGILNFLGLLALDLVEKSDLYDLDKFTYIGQIAQDDYVLAVGADSPFYTLEDLQKARRVKFADTDVGSTAWVLDLMIGAIMEVPVDLIFGYGGSAACIVGVVRGDCDALTAGGISLLLPYIEAGDLRPIIQFTTEPTPFLPDVPALKGTGYEKMAVIKVVRFVAVPPGTPKEIADVLEASLMKALKSEELQEWSKKVKRPLFPATGAEASEIKKALIEMLSEYEAVFKQ